MTTPQRERCPGSGQPATEVFGDRYPVADCPACGRYGIAVTANRTLHAHGPTRPATQPVIVGGTAPDLQRQLHKHHDLYRHASEPPEACPECGAKL